MRYLSIIVLALVFGSTCVFAQDEKSPQVIPMEAGLAPAVLPHADAKFPSTDSSMGPKVPKNNNYEVGVDDVLDINVIKPVPVTTRIMVTSDGTFTFPYIGSVQAQGQTLDQIQTDIQNRLTNYMDYPVVSVSLWEARSKKIIIYGQVYRPGAYAMQTGMSLLRSISLAGGLSVPGSAGVVKILRPNIHTREKKVVFESEIGDILNGAEEDVPLSPGDTVIVSLDRFFISGEVYRPGSYYLQENMSLLNAITAAGGFIKSGSVGRIKLIRAHPQSDEAPVFESDINSIFTDGPKVKIHAGDTVEVLLDKYFITGQVNHPGAYWLEDKMSLLNAISVAGGLRLMNSNAKVKLLRPAADGKSQQMVETDFTSILNGTAPEIIVHASDTIVVTANKFYVYGEVNRPGMYLLESQTTAMTAISIAGGFSKFGSASRIKVVRMNEKTGNYKIMKVNITSAIQGNSKSDLLLMPGDVVVVSEGLF